MSVRYPEQSEQEMDSIATATTTGREPMAAAAVPTGARAVTEALQRVRKPSRPLLSYYALQSLVTGPGILVLLPLRYFRYRTLHYVFDDEGVTMRWGLLFRREVTLTYARIQESIW